MSFYNKEMYIDSHDLKMLEVENLIERAFDIVKGDEWDADAVGEVFKEIQ